MAKQNNVFANYNPNMNDLYSFIEAYIRKALMEVQTSIPAVIRKVVDRNTVIVEPAIEQLNPDWERVQWAQIKLPVLYSAGGGFAISMPLSVGDTGWIVAGDLDDENFLREPSVVKQNTFERHKYQFGFFVPNGFNKYEFSSDDEGALVVQTKNGDTKITIKEDTITIASKSELNINAETVKINGSSKVLINDTDWKTHNHTVPSGIALSATESSTPGVYTGSTTATAKTGGVN